MNRVFEAELPATTLCGSYGRSEEEIE